MAMPFMTSAYEASISIPDAIAGRVDLNNSSLMGEVTVSGDAHTSRLQCSGLQIAVTAPGTLHRSGDIVCAATASPVFHGTDDQSVTGPAAAAKWIDGYRRYGKDVVRHVRGSWSVVIIDLEQRTVIAAVDRFGSRGLCFTSHGGQLAFATRADEVPAASREIDPQAVYDYLYHHFIPAPQTIFRSVSRLGSADRLVATAREVTSERYWIPNFRPIAATLAARKEEFLDTLAAAVRDCMAGGRTGCYLSGGTDSSTVAGMATRVSGTAVDTFSIGFDAEGYDEMEYARIAARHFGTNHHEYYFKPSDLVENMPLVAAYYDQPFGNSSALPAFFCARLAHDCGITRMLAGDGGDELFGGNSRYATESLFAPFYRLPEPVKRTLEGLVTALPVGGVPVLRKARRYVELARMPVPARLQSYNLLTRLGPESILSDAFLTQVDRTRPQRDEINYYALAQANSTLDRILAFEWKYILSDNDLPKVTGTAALAGVTAMFPLLDDRLVDFSMTLPPRLKVRGRRLRYFFKEALKGFLPDEIIRKRKHGFGLPFGVWLAEVAPLRELAHEALGSIEKRGWLLPNLREQLMGKRLREHAAYYGEMVWVLVMLELWLSRRGANATACQ